MQFDIMKQHMETVGEQLTTDIAARIGSSNAAAGSGSHTSVDDKTSTTLQRVEALLVAAEQRETATLKREMAMMRLLSQVRGARH